MKIVIIGGFLGSGKTTALAQLAGYLVDTGQDPVVILENEVSDTGIDDRLLARSGFQVRKMLSGCICCSSSAQLSDTIKKIKEEYQPKWLLIEATGLAYPDAIWETIHTGFQIDAKILTLADASRWIRLRRAMPQFADSQLKKADVILISKTDLATCGQLSQIKDSIRQLNTCAHILEISLLQSPGTRSWENILNKLGEGHV